MAKLAIIYQIEQEKDIIFVTIDVFCHYNTKHKAFENTLNGKKGEHCRLS